MLRPTPSEIVAGIARILREEVAPAIDADHDHVREQLVQIVAVLGQVDWDDAGFAMVRADRAARRLLDDVRAWAAADPGARALVTDAAEIDDADDADRDDATSFAVARERAEASRRALAAVVTALTGPGDAPAGSADVLERIAEHFTQEEPPPGGTTHSG